MFESNFHLYFMSFFIYKPALPCGAFSSGQDFRPVLAGSNPKLGHFLSRESDIVIETGLFHLPALKIILTMVTL